MQPNQALDALLRALGVPAEYIPDGAEARAGLYRSVLARIGGPALIIADNASAEAQVRLLLPGPGPHRVIITSRHTLGGLGARLLDIKVLDQAAAVALLDGVLRTARPGDDRISSDHATADKLAETCGGLPLALQITAALLATDQTLTTGDLTGMLSGEVGRLEALRYDDGTGISAPSVAAAFELSYRQLDSDAARLFRLLSAGSGPDVSTAGAAALAGWPLAQARSVLGRLAKAHLVEAADGRGGRWRMHDLLDLYARQLVDADEREKARDRLLAYYQDRVQVAGAHLKGMAGTRMSAEFTGRDEALTWLDAERPSLITAVAIAASTGRDWIAVSLPLNLSEYLSWRRRFDDWLTVLAMSRDAARRQGDRANEAVALSNLGLALSGGRRFGEAITVLQQARLICQETNDRHSEGMALNNLGLVLQEVRRFDEAITVLQQATVIFRQTNDRHSEGRALNSLGSALAELRRFGEAITAHQDAAVISRVISDRHGEGMALNNLGAALQEAGRLEEAISAHHQATVIFRETNDRHREGMALTNLGAALQGAGRSGEAIRAHQDAAAIFRETNDRHGEGRALHNLGSGLHRKRRFEEAARVYREAAVIFREANDRHGEGVALNNLGLALTELRRCGEAISAHEDAAAIFRETGDQHHESLALKRSELARTTGSKTDP